MNARDKLIDTARTLLSRQGYESTSPRDIQRDSGVGQGSFYHHFDSKADLASAALHSLAEEMSNQFDDITAGTEPIRAYLDAPRQPLAGCRIGRMTMETSMADERIQAPIGGYFNYLRGRLTAAFDDLDLGVEAAALADLAIAAVQGGYVVARATNDQSAQTNATSALIELLQAIGTRDNPRKPKDGT